ncbi:response regulator transcription factor [Rathayibacter soli]|uniref:response regulator transcription factor n=1 Tax=Rathayibacter soli TaxID=3144168 RepID=UPI0027E5B560|nr:helix-turn-helix transcriptional regulator [Glaciibacter superstes]
MTQLSTRERDVLRLLARGLTNAAIAAMLFLSERTVDAHIRSIFAKLNLHADAATNRRVLTAIAWFGADAAAAPGGDGADAFTEA